MNRCMAAFSAAFLFSTATALHAQGFVREAPKDVKHGYLVVTAPPEVTLNGKPDRLSPGARIRGVNNLLLLSGTVVGQKLPVVYRRDAAGLVHEAWVLTPEEDSRLGGSDGGGDAQGYRRFNELLALIFGARR